MKRGKMLGGKPPGRGGRLTRTRRERTTNPPSGQFVLMLALGCLVIGIVGGFAYSLDRELSAGLLSQRVEAMQRPDWVSLDRLPPYVAEAFIIAVDPGFEEAGTLRTRDERSTTIPRELVREIHLLDGSLGGSAREMLMAPLLEQRTTKDELLAFYLNRVYLGESNGLPVYGVHYAAEEYLEKPATQLTLSEAATLAGLLLEPRIEQPRDRAGAVGARRNEVLQALRSAGYIDEEQYRQARDERLAFQPGLAALPMSGLLLTPEDTAVIRLPPPAARSRPDPENPD